MKRNLGKKVIFLLNCLERIIIIHIFAPDFKKQGRLAQLVQSICLTSRGSAVRIRQRPRKVPFLIRVGSEKGAFFYFIYGSSRF